MLIMFSSEIAARLAMQDGLHLDQAASEAQEPHGPVLCAQPCSAALCASQQLPLVHRNLGRLAACSGQNRMLSHLGCIPQQVSVGLTLGSLLANKP